jgi:TolA-binding protein
MKAKERHDLKQNEFAATTMQVVGWVTAHREWAAALALAAIAVVALAGGYAWWRQSTANAAGALLGAAAAIAQSPIAPAPTVPGAAQQSGTFPTESARLDAALAAYEQVMTEYPGTDAALTARYAIGTALLDAGRAAEAEQAFDAVIADAGRSIYGPLARLGRGQALVDQQKFDDAIALFTELSADRSSQLPLDGVLIQLARASSRAGRTDDARAAFKRIVDEFPASTYVAEARQELARLG